jgi:hypothetical protein
MQLTIFYDGQFWVGLIERQVEKKYYSTLHTFGEEPGDGQILEFVSDELLKIINRQSSHVISDKRHCKKINPKRLKRIAAMELEKNPMSTKSQAAIQKQMEENKKERKEISKKEKEVKKEYKRKIASEKRKNRHKGR